MRDDLLREARRQAAICNACRYCEGYCAVFPALNRQGGFGDGDLAQLANLCHDCRGCYYACQYTAPHEFDLNLPAALAGLRRASWEEFAWPSGAARVFRAGAIATMLGLVMSIGLILWAMRVMAPPGGAGFYAVMSHATMLAIFLPAFAFPMLSLAVSARRYWRATGGAPIARSDILSAARAVATMRNLSGGHGEGCNFEDGDAFSQARRHAHQAVFWGFLLCLAATGSGTILHYAFDSPAPYPPLSLPKLFGVPGGLLMVGGTLWLAALKMRADRAPGDAAARGAELAFVLLLFLVAASGLLLYGLGGTAALPALLAFHLATVLCFFLLIPFTKMAHALYRPLALIRDAQRRRG